ncbi:NADH dehydrogenase-like protein YjlD [Arthrobacter saudimassiliensis]|uniref:NADH dehydrogenase-like protein YjlD n=1 Tax=Arthrobacter saudimassiliensis TaxID=1461584 RepID=A0A078MRE3_9MICC|nr:NADH dehydrogenase-like protein YjlD [Arthrobacter saudimassiliensis]
MSVQTRVLILGGGYAGVMAANRLAAAARPGLAVRLVNPRGQFVERIRLHEYAAGTRAGVAVPFDRLLHPAVRQVPGTAVAIDAGRRTVGLADGETLPYDYLLYAVGSTGPAAPAGALAVADVADAAAARTSLRSLPAGAAVAIVGGGLTALETAAETARAHPRLRVHLWCSALPGPSLPEPSRAGLLRSLRRAGVQVHPEVPVSAAADPRGQLGADLVLWCTGFSVPDLAARSALPVDGAGRLRVDASLRAAGQDRVFGAGDAAVIEDPGYAYLRMSCAAAMPMGAEAAGNILRALEGLPLRRHDSGFQAQCISLGRADGLVQFVGTDDTPRSLHLHGRTAAVLKEIICRMTLRWIRSEAKRSGAYSWPKGPRALRRTPVESRP